jgi:hypothetical protein
MSRNIRYIPETQSSLAFGSIVAGYTAINTGFTRPIRQLFVQNLTDGLLQFSFDGTNDHFPLPANGFMLVDVTANEVNNEGFFIGQGTIISVKRIDTPTSGSVYVSAFYGGR